MAWQREQDDSWCAMLCFLRPHNPTVAPEPYNGLVDPGSLAAPVRAATPENEAAIHPLLAKMIAQGEAGTKCIPGMSGRVADVMEADWRSIRAIHLGLMAEIDENLGRLFQQLKDVGQWEDTLILFSSDHGEAMFDHYLCNQAAWIDQCAHVPLILRDPSSRADASRGSVVDDFSAAIDTIPTLLDWLGAKIPHQLDGASLLPFVQGERPDNWREYVTWEYHYDQAVETEGSRVVAPDTMMTVYRDRVIKHVFMPGLPCLLFDMENDPAELRNLSGDPAYSNVERDYLHRQLAHRIRYVDGQFSPHRQQPEVRK